MQNIVIGRYEQDPEAQGVIKPADGRWQLVIDKDGYPHLYVECNIRDNDGTLIKGMFLIEDMLPPDLGIRDLMDGGEFDGRPSPEDEQRAYEEWLERKERLGIPCPKP